MSVGNVYYHSHDKIVLSLSISKMFIFSIKCSFCFFQKKIILIQVCPVNSWGNDCSNRLKLHDIMKHGFNILFLSRSALSTLGLVTVGTGYWPHDIMMLGVNILGLIGIQGPHVLKNLAKVILVFF